MQKPLLNKAKIWFLRFIQIQLFLTLISMPILIAWGLPISLMAPVGNLIFGPILTMFLFLSSLIFFFEILHIPNLWLIYCLEKLTHIWLYCLNWCSKSWLIGFTKPTILLLIIIPFFAFGVLYWRKTNTIYRSIVCFLLILFFSGFYLKYSAPSSDRIEKIPCNNGYLTVLYTKNNTLLIDPGVLGARISAPSFVQYTLIPHIIQTTGRTTIDHVILTKPGNILFQGVKTLIEKMKVKNVYLVMWDGTLPKAMWHSFFTMRDTTQNHDTALIRIAKKSVTIALEPKKIITIKPLEKKIKKDAYCWPALEITGSIDNELVTFYHSGKINREKSKKESYAK